MVNDDSSDFTQVMADLEEALPDLADQVKQEIRRGRIASEQRLRQEEDYGFRTSRLAEADLQALGKADIAVLPYTDDERIELVREAILTLAETMYVSRRTTLDIALEEGTELTITFGDPELEALSEVDLPAETERARVAFATVRGLLSEGRDSSIGANW